MTQRISRTARGVFAALVAAGLTFGAGAALASASAMASCPYNPSQGQIGLACTTHKECAVQCRQIYGEWSDGLCGFDGCCICAY
jgi:hypothetical protein